MNVRKVDEIDKKILFLLSENARISYVDIGKEVNLSRVAVKSRIDNLEENGIKPEILFLPLFIISLKGYDHGIYFRSQKTNQLEASTKRTTSDRII